MDIKDVTKVKQLRFKDLPDYQLFKFTSGPFYDNEFYYNPAHGNIIRIRIDGWGMDVVGDNQIPKDKGIGNETVIKYRQVKPLEVEVDV